MIREGQRVGYIGDDPRIGVGTEGRALATSGNNSHVQWSTGSRVDQVDLCSQHDLVVISGRPLGSDMDDAMAFDSPLVSEASVDAYTYGGAPALLASLADEGYASHLPDLAEQVMQFAASSVRNDPSFREVIASLDDDAAEAFVTHTVGMVLADASRESCDGSTSAL